MEDKILAIMDNHHCIVSEELGNRCAKELSALIDQEVKKAVEFTLKNVSSIDYPLSGKTYNFEGGEWRNLLSMATEYVLAELEGYNYAKQEQRKLLGEL